MEEMKVTCPGCGKDVPNKVLYRCIRCFSVFCVVCDKSQEGKNCPKCGMNGRMVLDQGVAQK